MTEKRVGYKRALNCLCLGNLAILTPEWGVITHMSTCELGDGHKGKTYSCAMVFLKISLLFHVLILSMPKLFALVLSSWYIFEGSNQY